jgi:hypothetical protein
MACLNDGFRIAYFPINDQYSEENWILTIYNLTFRWIVRHASSIEIGQIYMSALMKMKPDTAFRE